MTVMLSKTETATHIAACERAFALAQRIVADPRIADDEARRIHDGRRWSKTELWRAACRKTAATMRNAAERIVKNGQATYVTVIDGKRWRIGADLLDPSEMGYIPLFEEP